MKRLFDYQKFEQNEDLQRVIDSVHARYATRELNLDEMSMANAAGDPSLMAAKKQEQPRK
jgi:hypothetical protein